MVILLIVPNNPHKTPNQGCQNGRTPLEINPQISPGNIQKGLMTGKNQAETSQATVPKEYDTLEKAIQITNDLSRDMDLGECHENWNYRGRSSSMPGAARQDHGRDPLQGSFNIFPARVVNHYTKRY
jgi:hypothetical protein